VFSFIAAPGAFFIPFIGAFIATRRGWLSAPASAIVTGRDGDLRPQSLLAAVMTGSPLMRPGVKALIQLLFSAFVASSKCRDT
jgi:hypothetical protein